ncbi:MAG: polyphenol oxidase family protein [Solirubrobacteraceae bacterium]
MKLPPAFQPLGDHLTIALPGARAVFTTRRGGESQGPHWALNLGGSSGDRPELVARNRAIVERQLGVRLAGSHQVHGTRVRRIATGANPAAALEAADGQATTLRGLAPTALTADCLPIAIAGGGAVAMVHAGWRGLAGGILAEGVRAVRELGAAGSLGAAIGPGAGPCCYEVGDEVHGIFASHDPGPRDGRRLDMKAIARRQLEAAGVEAVADTGLCTMCSDPRLFFSHRRDAGVTGRQAGIAWLT